MKPSFLILAILSCLLFTAPSSGWAKTPADDSGGQYQSVAIERLQQALEVDPNNLPLRYYLGVSLLIAGQDQAAVDAFRLAYPAFSDSVEMNYNFALAYTRLGDVDSAQIYLNRAEELGALQQLELYPIDNLYFNLALLQLGNEQLPAAIESLQRVLTLDPENQEVLRLLGDLYSRQGDLQQARDYWGRFLALNPDNEQVKEQLFAIYYNDALRLLDAKQPDAAAEQFRQALQLVPDSPLPLYYLGYLSYQKQDYVNTIDLLSAAFTNAPEDIRESLLAMVYNSATELLKAKQPEAAKPAVTLLTEGDPNDLRANYLAGTIQLELKRYLQARETFLKALKADPSHSGATLSLVKAEQGAAEELFVKGRELYRSKRYREAVIQLEQALSIDKAHPMARAYLQQAQDDLNNESKQLLVQAQASLATDPQQALDLARRALAMDPTSSEAEQLASAALAALESKLNDLLANAQAIEANGAFEKAESFYQQAVALDPTSTTARDGLEKLQQLRQAEADRLAALGNSSLDEGELAPARAAFQKALELVTGHQQATQGLERADALLASLKAEALQLAHRARQAGRIAEAREQLAKAYRLSGDPAVKAELDELDAAANNQLSALLNEADQSIDGDDYHRARNLLAKAEALAPGNPEVSRRLSELEAKIAIGIKNNLNQAEQAYRQKDYQEAIASYREVLKTRPDHPDALDGVRKSRKALANELNQLIADGGTAIDGGDYPKAQALLERALALDPYQADALAAKQRLESLLHAGLHPGDEDRLYLSGIDLYTSGRYQDAVATWKQVLILDPANEKARLNIAKAERKLKQIEEYRHEQ